MTHYSKVYSLTKGQEIIQVIDPKWLQKRSKDFTFMTFGLFQARIQGLHRPQEQVKISCYLLDTRWNEMEKMLLGAAQLDFNDNVAYFNVIPGLTFMTEALEHMKLIIVTKGYDDFDKRYGTIAVEFQSYCMFH